MRHIIIIIMALMFAGSVFGQSVQCSSSHRLAGTLIKVGDSERRVIQAQRPDREVQLETRQGGAAGYRLDYYLHQYTLQVYVQSGVITRICRVRN